MLFDIKFDLILSIGEDCACTSYLRRFKLQNYSYPFDWLTKASFESRMELILNEFDGFLEFDSLYPIEKPNSGNVDNNCDYFADKKYGFFFYHDFRSGFPLETEYKIVKAKYDRRIQRFYENIKNADNILFVWWSRDKHQDINIIKNYYQNLKEKFNSKQIYILLIEYGENEEKTFLCDGHVLLVKYDNITYALNNKWTETMGHEANNMAFFSEIKLKRTINWYLKYCLFGFVCLLVNIIPVKSVRKKLRADIKQYFYKATL